MAGEQDIVAPKRDAAAGGDVAEAGDLVGARERQAAALPDAQQRVVDLIVRDQARDSVSALDGGSPISSTGGGSAIAGVPLASMSLIAMKACAPDAPSTAAWWTRWSIAKLPFGMPGILSSPSMT